MAFPSNAAGIIVQLAGSKTWMLYDETITVPRPDQKFKPSAALLGEPFSVVELRPGDLMYIPRQAKASSENWAVR